MEVQGLRRKIKAQPHHALEADEGAEDRKKVAPGAFLNERGPMYIGRPRPLLTRAFFSEKD